VQDPRVASVDLLAREPSGRAPGHAHRPREPAMDPSTWKTLKVEDGDLKVLMIVRSLPGGAIHVSVDPFHDYIRPKLPVGRWLLLVVKGDSFASASVESPLVQIGSGLVQIGLALVQLWFGLGSALVQLSFSFESDLVQSWLSLGAGLPRIWFRQNLNQS